MALDVGASKCGVAVSLARDRVAEGCSAATIAARPHWTMRCPASTRCPTLATWSPSPSTSTGGAQGGSSASSALL
jgi:hypothetical protein